MAANFLSRGRAIFGKRFVGQIRCVADRSTVLSVRSEVHTSVYDKNVEENVRASVVPDDVIPPQSDKYWSPHPQTGVFGPETDHNNTSASGPPTTDTSVLEQKAFFRPLEDLDKPLQP